MTAHSEYGRYIRGVATAAQLAQRSPVDSSMLRDGVTNNINHLVDECTETLVNMCGSWQSRTDDENSGVYYYLRNLLPIQVPIRLLSNGESVRIVVLLRGRALSAGTATFRVALTGRAGSAESASSYAVASVSTTSTTGADISAGPLYLRPSDFGGAGFFGSIIEVPSLDGSGRAATAQLYEARLHILATSGGGLPLPELTRVYAREYIGG